MANDGSRLQIQNFLVKAYEESKYPDIKKRIKEKRQLKKNKIASQYGL